MFIEGWYDASRRPGSGILRALGLGALLFALACASSQPAPAPAAAPAPAGQKTAADPTLQRTIAGLIDQCEKRIGATGKVVDTRFVRLEDNTLVESWIVARGDEQVAYTVELTPGEKGVEVGIPDCPPKPRSK